MLSIIICLLSSVVAVDFISVMVTVSCLIPLSFGIMYNTTNYAEEWLWCINQMNGWLSFLTLTILLLVAISTVQISAYYFSLHLLLCVVVMAAFGSSNFLSFYVLFESSLIPILLIILSWGYQPERLQAGIYIIMYTVLGSMPLLAALLYIAWSTSYISFYWLINFYDGGYYNAFMLLGMLAFLVNLPAYPFHAWLPKAHVEAPLGGSIVLAGVLLKLGGYGLYLYHLIIPIPLCFMPVAVVISSSIWGGLVAAFVCLFQSDINSIIAYSSVVHMSIVIVGILSGTSWGFSAALITILSHGWASSALFLAAYTTYNNTGSRSFLYTNGLLSIYPPLSLFWFLLCSLNISIPPTINFMGELLAIVASNLVSWVILLLIVLIIFISVAYNIYIYSNVNHGCSSAYINSSNQLSAVELLSLLTHCCPLALLFCVDIICLYTVVCIINSYTIFGLQNQCFNLSYIYMILTNSFWHSGIITQRLQNVNIMLQQEILHGVDY